MDNGNNQHKPRRTRSLGCTHINAGSTSWISRSVSVSGALPLQVDSAMESKAVSEAGDIGDRALNSYKRCKSPCLWVQDENGSDNGVTFPVPEYNLLQSYGFWSHDAASNTVSLVSPLPEEIISPLAPKTGMCSDDDKQVKAVPRPLEYISCLVYLAVFGILGVLTRYSLQKLFGPSVAGVTSDLSILYLDLPSNMVGSFLMGWFGVVFKTDISRLSDSLAIGLSTGYLGSLTTFSGWNQKMLELTIDGHWLFSFLGFLIGFFLAAYSIIFGVETARGFRWLLNRRDTFLANGTANSSNKWRVDTCMHQFAVMAIMMLILGGLLSISGLLLKKEFHSGSSASQLWLGCIVGPLGVWIRWFLARLNGHGLGRIGILKWLPFGTLIANVLAAGLMTALATLKKAVRTKTCNTVASGLQLGFMGCLSTVSTFMAEFNAMRESAQPWRAYAYTLITIVVSFGMGILIYSVPTWEKGLEEHV